MSPLPAGQAQRFPALWTRMEQLQNVAEVTHLEEPNSIGGGQVAEGQVAEGQGFEPWIGLHL